MVKVKSWKVYHDIPDKRSFESPWYYRYCTAARILKSFSLITMLTKLTTSLALLAMATTVVDALMSYCLKHKKVYLKMKYSEVKVTEDEHGSLNYRALDEGEGSI